MSRFFCEVKDDDTAIVRGDEAAHMVRTLRMREGDAFTGIDGSPLEYACEITGLTANEVQAKVLQKSLCPAEPKIALTVYQAYPKAAKMETILQKCVELGLAAFVPFISERCVKKPEKDDCAKTERLKRVAMEAVKQCGRSRVPYVSTILSMNEVLKKIPQHDLCLLAWEEETCTSLKLVLQKNWGIKDIAVIIGPEGGFSETEAQAMKSAGAKSVSLGGRIMRTETAGMAACAVIMYELEG